MAGQSTVWFPSSPGEWNTCVPGYGFVCLLQTTLAGFRVCGEWVICDASSPASLCRQVLWGRHVVSHLYWVSTEKSIMSLVEHIMTFIRVC